MTALLVLEKGLTLALGVMPATLVLGVRLVLALAVFAMGVTSSPLLDSILALLPILILGGLGGLGVYGLLLAAAETHPLALRACLSLLAGSAAMIFHIYQTEAPTTGKYFWLCALPVAVSCWHLLRTLGSLARRRLH